MKSRKIASSLILGAALALAASVPGSMVQASVGQARERQKILSQSRMTGISDTQTTVQMGSWHEAPEMVLLMPEQETAEPAEKLYEIDMPAELQREIAGLCEQYEYADTLIFAIVMTESGGNPDALGDNGQAVGLMQIQPRWHQEMIEDTGLDPYVPIENVELGILYLDQCMRENNYDLVRALKQYNSGDPEYPRDDYVGTVMDWYDRLDGELRIN